MQIPFDIKLRSFWRIRLAAGFLFATALFSGCDTPDSSNCSPACTNGQTCDSLTKTCISPKLARFDGALPGRSVRIGVVGEQAYLAVIDPARGLILVGAATATEPPEMYALAELARPSGNKLALATSEATVAVAWLDSNDRYQVAIHRVGDALDNWRILGSQHGDHSQRDGNRDDGANQIDDAELQGYRGSEHFDLLIEPIGLDQSAPDNGSQRMRLVFHDAQTHALRVLSATVDSPRGGASMDWELLTIDDPAEQRDEAVCSTAQRNRVGRGVGFEPDIISRAGSTFVAYRDADCGDLRLARRFDSQWQVSVIDTGDFEREDDLTLTRGVTGKFASAAIDSHGNLGIAYFDATRGQLLVAIERAGRFIIEVADPGFEIDATSRKRKHLVGGFASLVFDADDIPRIAYIDATTAQLRMAYRTRKFGLEGDWVQRTLDAPAPTGFSASLGFSAEFGMVLAAEHLEPGPDGIDSELHFLSGESL